jgi:RimJ/RimL family protein N-acetyltransferase
MNSIQPLHLTAAAAAFPGFHVPPAAAAGEWVVRPAEARMAGRFILDTERLLLREFDEGDAAAFYVLGGDPAIIRYTGDLGGGLASVEHAAEILRSHPIADYRKHGFGRWACVHKGNGAVVGFAGLKAIPA